MVSNWEWPYEEIDVLNRKMPEVGGPYFNTFLRKGLGNNKCWSHWLPLNNALYEPKMLFKSSHTNAFCHLWIWFCSHNLNFTTHRDGFDKRILNMYFWEKWYRFSLQELFQFTCFGQICLIWEGEYQSKFLELIFLSIRFPYFSNCGLKLFEWSSIKFVVWIKHWWPNLRHTLEIWAQTII